MLHKDGILKGEQERHSVKVTLKNYYKETLANRHDFKTQKPAMQVLLESRGHILLMSPKYHPELAGLGIEYTWGYSKMISRGLLNDCVL